jgi:hypothetical protein
MLTQAKTPNASDGGRLAPLVPNTLKDLLAIPRGELGHMDIARMNLLCAAGLPGTENMPVERYLRVVDAWARQVRVRTQDLCIAFQEHPDEFQRSEALWRLWCLTRVLWQECKLHYCPDEIDLSKDANWADASRHLIHGLLGPQRHGTCASLPVLLAAVGRRLGYPMRLVHSPGHVFSRWDGLDHPNPAWREKRNIEFNGDFDSFPDEHYYERPRRWLPVWHEMERLRPLPLYLRSLTPAEELASFLAQRGHVLQAHELFIEAHAAYVAAHQLAAHDETYLVFARECNARHLDRILRPWGLTAHDYFKVVEQRLTGTKMPFPWETPDGKLLPGQNPFCNPKDAASLTAAQQAVLARLTGFIKLPKALEYLQSQFVSSARPGQSLQLTPSDAVDEILSADFSTVLQG